MALFEAARRAPSAYNEQPWRFIVAAKDAPEDYARLLACLNEGNRKWAESAPVLIVSVAKLALDRNGRPNRHAWYDLGQATAALVAQATDLGLHAHQMGGFDRDRVRAEFGVPEGFEPVTALAIGYVGDEQPGDRNRLPLEELVFSGSWGKTWDLLTT